MKKPVKNTKPATSQAASLRKLAEKMARKKVALSPNKPGTMSPEEVRQTLHELQVHQIELEMQNEEMCRTQVELNAAWARYFDLYDLAPVGYCTISAQWMILEANLTAAIMLNVARGKLMNQLLTRFIMKEDQDIYYLYRKQLLDTGEPQTCELRMVKKDGSVFWAHLAGATTKDESGATVCRVVMSDIIERKSMEEKLRSEEQRFRALAEQSSDIIVLVNRERIITYENPAVEKYLGFKAEERIGIKVFDRIHPDDLKFATDAFNAFILNTSSKDINAPVRQIRLRHQDGSWRMFEAVGSKLVHDNFVEFVIVNLRDITERKQAEDELQQSEIKYRTLFESANDAIFLLDHDMFIDCNQKALEMFRCTREQIIGQPPYRFSPEVQPDGRNSTEQAQEKNNTVLKGQPQFFEWKHCRYDGTLFDAEISLNFISDMGKNYIQAICRDITERKQTEEYLKKYREHLEELVRERTIKLESSNKELEAFSYSASHDLRAPLRSIDGFSQALLEDCEDKLDMQGKDYLIRIRAATKRMADLIEDLLQLSRLTRTEMNIEKINLTRIARSVIDELQKSHPQRHVEIKIGDGLEDTADSRLMRITLENLLGNAWKFTEKQVKAVIEFGCTEEGGKKVYFIRDNGVGFDMAYVDKLFAPFQRLHNEEEFPGTGIGLALVRRIIHRHGGKVWTEGQTDKGATFYFSLNEK